MKVVIGGLDRQEVLIYRDALKGVGDVVCIEGRLADDDIESFKDADILSVFVFDKLGKETLSKFPNLKLVITRSAGYDHIDIDFCKTKGIRVANIPAYSPSAIAQHAFSLILSLTRKLKTIDLRVRDMDFSQGNLHAHNLENLTLGVIGTGRIGSLVCRYGLSFGMNVVAYDLEEKKELRDLGVRYVDMDELLNVSDIISLHVPYTSETHHLIDRNAIERMKEGVILVNTSRGGVLDTKALYKRIDKFAGVGLDVFEREEELILKLYRKGRSSPESMMIAEMANVDKVIVTPHIAYLTEEAVNKIRSETIRMIRHFAEGKAEDITYVV